MANWNVMAHDTITMRHNAETLLFGANELLKVKKLKETCKVMRDGLIEDAANLVLANVGFAKAYPHLKSFIVAALDMARFVKEHLVEDHPTCILTGALGENPDDCTTHDHE